MIRPSDLYGEHLRGIFLRVFSENDRFHKVWKEDQGMPGGGRNNPDLSDDEIKEAYDEWVQNSGKPET